jgi:hypothetical protein
MYFNSKRRAYVLTDFLTFARHTCLCQNGVKLLPMIADYRVDSDRTLHYSGG